MSDDLVTRLRMGDPSSAYIVGSATLEEAAVRITELEADKDWGCGKFHEVASERNTLRTENARLSSAGKQLATLLELLRVEMRRTPMHDPQVALDDEAFKALTAWAALSGEPTPTTNYYEQPCTLDTDEEMT